MSPGEAVLLVLSAAMASADAAVSAAYLLQGRAAAALSWATGAAAAERRGLDRVYTLVWLAAGAAALWELRPPPILAVPTILSFKSGADLGSRVIYASHDLSLLRRSGAGAGVLGRALGRVVALSAVPSILFLVVWWIFGQSVGAAASILMGSGLSPGLGLWALGAAFGAAFGAVRSRGERGILLGGELALVAGSALLRAAGRRGGGRGGRSPDPGGRPPNRTPTSS